MRAVVVKQPGRPEDMSIGEIPDPRPGPGELLVRVRATALNRLDLLQRQGRYPVPPGAPETLGVEMAGDVEGWGAGVSGWQQGERVCALILGGGYAELVAVPAAMAMRIPANLSYEEAAGIPEAYLTAYLNLFLIGGLQAGGYALFHAGASGVGTAAIQLIREAGAHAIVTVGSAEKAARCRELGAIAALNYRQGPFEPGVMAATGGRGVDLIIDTVGAPYWEQNLNCLVTAGRLIILAMQGGGTLEQVNLGVIQRKRIRVIGSVLRPLPLEEKIDLTARFAEFAMDRFADGRLISVVDRVYPWDEAPEAHRYMESNANIGKIVLRVS
ncbi:MAG TPA: NAD(P)H-quinone oxidoreductase [Chloroflexota bacterium]|nr:NAD(P)H-quinone oxidoreductase [Chloroflexota bacterium]